MYLYITLISTHFYITLITAAIYRTNAAGLGSWLDFV